MSVTLNDAIKEAYEYAPGDITYWDTLEFNHNSFASPIRIVNSYKPLVTLSDGTFQPVRFTTALPENSSGVRGEMSITLQAIPISIRKEIRGIASSRTHMTITYRQYIAENAIADATIPMDLQTVAVLESDTGIEIRASVSGLIAAKFPRRIMLTQDLIGAIT